MHVYTHVHAHTCHGEHCTHILCIVYWYINKCSGMHKTHFSNHVSFILHSHCVVMLKDLTNIPGNTCIWFPLHVSIFNMEDENVWTAWQPHWVLWSWLPAFLGLSWWIQVLPALIKDKIFGAYISSKQSAAKDTLSRQCNRQINLYDYVFLREAFFKMLL